MALRKHFKRYMAAICITRLFRYITVQKARDTIYMVRKIKEMLYKKIAAATLIQQYMRGKLGRMYYDRIVRWRFFVTHSAKLIQRAYRACVAWRSRVVWRHPGESWVLRQCARRLALMIAELYSDWQRRQQLLCIASATAPAMQKAVRGFLARTGAKRLTYLRGALRSWLLPQFAVGFLSRYLDSKVAHNTFLFCDVHTGSEYIHTASAIPLAE